MTSKKKKIKKVKNKKQVTEELNELPHEAPALDQDLPDVPEQKTHKKIKKTKVVPSHEEEEHHHLPTPSESEGKVKKSKVKSKGKGKKGKKGKAKGGPGPDNVEETALMDRDLPIVPGTGKVNKDSNSRSSVKSTHSHHMRTTPSEEAEAEQAQHKTKPATGNKDITVKRTSKDKAVLTTSARKSGRGRSASVQYAIQHGFADEEEEDTADDKSLVSEFEFQASAPVWSGEKQKVAWAFAGFIVVIVLTLAFVLGWFLAFGFKSPQSSTIQYKK